MSKTKIEWATDSWNPIRARNLKTGKVGWHCEHATTGCEFCYAESMNKRLGTGLPFKPGHRKDIEIFLDEEMLTAPLRWKKPRMIFVCSMTDVFADFVKDEWLDKLFAVMALCPQHTFQVLTKRAERMREYFTKRRFLDVHPLEDRGDIISEAMNAIAPSHWCKRELQDYSEEGLPLPNVWLGVSCERQQEADERIPHLLQTPAAVRFISAEPLLGAIDLIGTLARYQDTPGRRCAVPLGRQLIDWVITGGESGPKARPSHIDWFRSFRDQCTAAGVAYFHKQNGEWLCGTQFTDAHRTADPNPEQSRHPCMNWDGKEFYQSGGAWCDDLDENAVFRVGKKSAGRLLDGREWNGMPEANNQEAA